MTRLADRDFVLGIDLGTNSVGWAMVEWKDGGPVGLLHAGSRVFDAGMEVDSKSGKESSRNLTRRTARQIRRQHWRRARRLKKVFHLLRKYGLLPTKTVNGPKDRQDFINELDKTILASSWFSARCAAAPPTEPQQVMPYLLRATAIDEPLEPFFLGRALFHLAQRRGFLSNRKATPDTQKDQKEDEGTVKSSIAELRKQMAESGARTLGEYCSRLSPSAKPIRGQWTARAMYEDEFEKIWETQKVFHPMLLTAERKKEFRNAVFFQRPLKVQDDLIGHCDLEPNHRRSPKYLLLPQRFRLLQGANHLRILSPDGTDRGLTRVERTKLIESLENEGDQTFATIRRLLGLGRVRFNLEEGGETRMLGNRTASQLYAVFGQHWLDMSPAERDSVVEYLHGFQRADKLQGAAQKKWQLDEATAAKFAAIDLEGDYFNLSRRAIEKLLPSLEEGASYADAKFNAYGVPPAEPKSDLLPPVELWREIRNPSVTRSLTELRKLVNAIVRVYGKPFQIRIELARDLRQTKGQREKDWKKSRENQRARDRAAKRILDEVGLRQPSRDDIRKVLLAEECQFICPYTNKSISVAALVGPESQFDIEHIIPFSRSLDDSFANLALCYHEENRSRKRNKTPLEAYGAEPDRWGEILERVKRFRSDFSREKLRRFQMTTGEVDEHLKEFTSRQLNDTRYATTLAADYLSLLYGGRIDGEGKQRICATAGQVTAFLRNEWRLNAILLDGPTGNGGARPKSREDHRHHAVDAVVTALTDNGTIQALSHAAQRAPMEHRRRFAALEVPWTGFVDSVRRTMEDVAVSHRSNKKISGALHEETFYSLPRKTEVAVKNIRRVRKPLENLSESEVEQIVDDRVRAHVKEKLQALGNENPAAVFAKPANLPFFETRDGRRIPIKSVRIYKKLPTYSVGSGRIARHVASDSNHHIEIVAELDRNGHEVEWDGYVVPLAEAYRRLKSRQPILQRDFGSNRKFVFSLSPGEMVECKTDTGERRIFVLRKMTQKSAGDIQIGLAPIHDARQAKIMQGTRAWLCSGPNALRRREARKVAVSPLGEVTEAHD